LIEQFPGAKVLTGIQYAVRPYPDLVLVRNGKVVALETKLSTTFQRNPYETMGMIADWTKQPEDRKIDHVILILVGPVEKGLKENIRRVFHERVSVIDVTEGVKFAGDTIERLDEKKIVAEIVSKIRGALQ
jgi:hypothetical protein